MDNKKISTSLGTILIIIFAATALAFVLVYENNRRANEVKNDSVKVVENNKKIENNNEEIQKPLDTSNWKICRDDKNRYEFKYPANWNIHVPVNRVIINCYNQTSLILASELPEESKQKVSFSMIKNTLSREDFISQNKAEIIIEKELEIGGNPALIYTKDMPIGKTKFIEIFKDGTSYALTATQLPSEAIFDALVSNFKLLDDTEKSVSTSNWKVCRNEKNGYAFKYPDTWRLGAPVNRDIYDCNKQIEKESLVMWSNIPGKTEKGSFSIISNATSREEFISQNKSEITIKKELEINGSLALIYTKNSPRGEIKFVSIFKDGTIYGLTASELSSDAIFDALVSNFKLLD